MIINLIVIYSALFSLMFFTWVFYLKTKKASYIDVVWALSFFVVTGISSQVFSGWWVRKIIIFTLVGIWSLRLTFHLWTRLQKTGEDGRYDELVSNWQKQGKNIQLRFFIFYQFQGVGTFLLSVPLYFIFSNPQTSLNIFEIIGIAIWIIAIIGESLADKQLKDFKKNSQNSKKTCRKGLWRYSRHPNYFFEWLIWVSYAVMTLAMPFGYTAFFSPLLMLYFVLFVTGIPPTEKQSLKSRGEDFRKYQKTTSAFVPWFPKKGESS